MTSEISTKSPFERAVHGAAATVIMTIPLLARWALQRDLPPPPLVVAENIQRAAGLRPERHRPLFRHAVWVAAHLGFGSMLTLAARAWPRGATTPASARSFGLAAWFANYGIVLPSLGIYPALTRDNSVRAIDSALSHLVYATALRRLTACR